jgi:hypothetical protein
VLVLEFFFSCFDVVVWGAVVVAMLFWVKGSLASEI